MLRKDIKQNHIVQTSLLFIIILTVCLIGSVASAGAIEPGAAPETDTTIEPTVPETTESQAIAINATRTLNRSTVEPGGVVRVTVITEFDSKVDPAVYEQFDTQIHNISINTTDPEPVVNSVTNSSDELAVVWESTNETIVTYDIQVSKNASSNETLNMSGMVEIENQTTALGNKTLAIENTSDNGGGDDGGSGGGGSGGGGGGGAQPTTPDPAVFEITELTPETATVTTDETIDVNATITNTGSLGGNQDVEMRIANETVQTESITLASDSTTEISFTDVPVPDDAGTVTHGVFTENQSETGTLTVEVTDEDSETDTDPNTNETSDDDESSSDSPDDANETSAEDANTDSEIPGFTGSIAVISILIISGLLRVWQP